jgi:hypothetical protein
MIYGGKGKVEGVCRIVETEVGFVHIGSIVTYGKETFPPAAAQSHSWPTAAKHRIILARTLSACCGIAVEAGGRTKRRKNTRHSTQGTKSY